MDNKHNNNTTKITIGSDENTTQTKFVVNYLSEARHYTRLFVSLAFQTEPWSKIAENVAEDVFLGKITRGNIVVLDWNGSVSWCKQSSDYMCYVVF